MNSYEPPTSLKKNELALTHSQGETWVMQTHADVARISKLQDFSIYWMSSPERLKNVRRHATS
jgi:hypothetical protein